MSLNLSIPTILPQSKFRQKIYLVEIVKVEGVVVIEYSYGGNAFSIISYKAHTIMLWSKSETESRTMMPKG